MNQNLKDADQSDIILAMRKDIWVFLFFSGMLLFNWPIISIFKDNFTIYPFLVWIILILLIFITTFLTEKEDRGG
jgi:ABC-type uncharacterized transport system fused permease/ATPase subunit